MRRARYSEGEITRMVTSYQELRQMADTRPGRRLNILIRLADLDRALDMLPMDLWRVVLVHGLLGVSQDESVRALKISAGAVSKRFRQGIAELSYLMNGGE